MHVLHTSFWNYEAHFVHRKEWARYLRRCKVYTDRRKAINIYLGIVILSWFVKCVTLVSANVHPNPGPLMNKEFSCISICHSNIRSLKQTCSTSGNNFKFNDVKCHLDNFDIITLSETWLTSGNSSNDYLIPGYQRPFRRDRGPDNGPPGYGGVIAWVSDKLACKRRTDLESNDLEALWFEVRYLNFKFFVCTLYRTSSNSDRSFWDKLQTMLFPLHESGTKFIILGDLNADPSTLEGKKLDEFIESNSLFSFISEPTRITDASATCVDQIITNLPGIIKSTKVEPPISSNDHCNISATLSFKRRNN